MNISDIEVILGGDMNSLSHELYAAAPAVDPLLFKKKGIVLIDDDEHFCSLMHLVGQNAAIPIQCYESLYQLGSFACLREFDLAILDFHLDSINGIEIAEYVDTFFRHLPVLLVSGDSTFRHQLNRWPTSIKHFITKAAGPFAILSTACKILERDRYLQRFQSTDEL
jgi:DNA-binding NtrC family response regulator